MDKPESTVYRTFEDIEAAFPPTRDIGEVLPLTAMDDVRIVNTGRCGRSGNFQGVRNNNTSRSIRVTVRAWDNLGNFDNTREHYVPAGGTTNLPGCTDLGNGQYMQNQIVGAQYT